MTVISPDVDELTDEDEVDEENLDAPMIYHTPGGIEVVDFNKELNEKQDPSTSKRPRKAKSEIKWQKNNPTYLNGQLKANTQQQSLKAWLCHCRRQHHYKFWKKFFLIT